MIVNLSTVYEEDYTHVQMCTSHDSMPIKLQDNLVDMHARKV